MARNNAERDMRYLRTLDAREVERLVNEANEPPIEDEETIE